MAKAVISIALQFPCLAARGTALGLISIALGLKELLVFNAENERGATIGALDGLVLKNHWMTSSLQISVRVSGHPSLK